MAQKPSRLDAWITERTWPRVRCPICGSGGLALSKHDVVLNNQSRREMKLARRDGRPPYDLAGTFSGTLTCDDAACGADVSMAGEWCHDFEDVEDDGQPIFSDQLRVRFVVPALRLLLLPAEVPQPVKAEVASAELVLFASPESAVSRL